MDSRESERINISNLVKDYLREDELYFEVNINGIAKFDIVDLSMTGVGFQAKGLDENQLDALKKSDELLIKLFIGDEFLIATVRIKWQNSGKDSHNNITVQGGAEFVVISPDDNIKLASLIERIRKYHIL